MCYNYYVKENIMELEMKNFLPQTEARLLNLEYNVLPVSVGATVNMSVQDEVNITKIEKNSISFECTRSLIMEPKSIFEAKATCFIKRVIDAKSDIDLTNCNIDTFVQHNLAHLVNTGFTNMSHLLASVTASFNGSPIITPPIPTQNTRIIRKA